MHSILCNSVFYHGPLVSPPFLTVSVIYMMTMISVYSILTLFRHNDFKAISKCYDLDNYKSLTIIISHFINILHLNTRSLKKNFDHLKSLILTLNKSPDIIALTETWLQPHTFHLYDLEGYDSYHETITTREHGGVSM